MSDNPTSADEVTRLTAENERLRAALKVFADEADAQDARNPCAHDRLHTVWKFTIGQVRAARAALSL